MSEIEDLRSELVRWRRDSAAAWDKCEENRLRAETAERDLAEARAKLSQEYESRDFWFKGFEEQKQALAEARAKLAQYERLYEAANGLSFGEDWNNGTQAKLHGYRQKLIDAVAAIRNRSAT